MNVSCIIVNWNTSRLLEDCLRSIEQSVDRAGMEVWVVDNASSDDSAAMVKGCFPWVHLIESPTNLGFGKANNAALPHTSGEYLLFLNQDTLVFPETLPELVRYLDAHPEVGAVGPRVLNPDGSPQASIHPTPTLFREAWRMFHLDRFKPVSQYPAGWLTGSQPRPVDVLMGSCMLIRRAIIDQIGLFDEQYFMYSEEVDLCERIRRAGWKIHFVPQSKIVHYGGQSTTQAAEAMFLELYRNKVKFFRKHYGEGTTRRYKRLLWLAAQPRILPGWFAGLLPANRRAKLRTTSHLYQRLVGELRGF